MTTEGFIFDWDEAAFKEKVFEQIMAARRKAYDDDPNPNKGDYKETPDDTTLAVLNKNVEIIARLARQEVEKLERDKAVQPSSPEDVATAISGAVATALQGVSGSAEEEYKVDTPLGRDNAVKIAAEHIDGYYAMVRTRLHDSIVQNLTVHPTEFAALWPQPTPGKKTEPGGTSPQTPEQPKLEEPPLVQPSNPPPASAATPPKTLLEIYRSGVNAAAALTDKGQIKAILRNSIKSSGGKPEDYPEKDIDGLAGVILKSGGEWLDAHEAEISKGNLSRDQITALSEDYALRVRLGMTEEKVGKFAGNGGPFSVFSLPDLVTGMDENSRNLPSYGMNIRDMMEAALTGAAGEEAAKRRYLEQLALEESHRQFYAENGDGVTPDIAQQTAMYQMRRRGDNSGTQNAVAEMAKEEFAPSNFGWLWTFFAYIGAFFSAVFGDRSQLAALLDGSYHADRHEKEAGENNYSLYTRIAHSSPQALGYDGPRDNASFAAWRSQLATDVTGIRPGNGSGVYVDHDADGATQGLAAVTIGLTPEGYGQAPGMEHIRGIPYDQIEQKERQFYRQEPEVSPPPLIVRRNDPVDICIPGGIPGSCRPSQQYSR